MAKNLRWKIICILGVIGLSVWSFYPPGQKVRLGLDLKGGVHLVLRVQTDDALKLEVQTTADRLREQLRTAKVPFEFPENGMELLWPTALDGDAAHAFLRDAIARVSTRFQPKPKGKS